MGAPVSPIQHDFVFNRLSPAANPNHQPYVKMVFFFKKRSDISYEDFHRHWETVHADLAVGCKPFALYLRRYTQFHQTPELKAAAQTCVEGMEVLDFDGCSEILVDSVEKAMEFFKSPEYVKRMNVDESNWLERPVRMMVGYDNLIFGEALPVPGTSDGLTDEDVQRALQ